MTDTELDTTYAALAQAITRASQGTSHATSHATSHVTSYATGGATHEVSKRNQVELFLATLVLDLLSQQNDMQSCIDMIAQAERLAKH
jgi:hypothetical protein